jgi:DNA-binding XRE family transcriptional regulator
MAAMDQENNVKKLREAKMLSKTELARLAGISPLTLDRIEKGKACRMATKRKILFALGLTIEQKQTLFEQ